MAISGLLHWVSESISLDQVRHRLVYQLKVLGLPTVPRSENDKEGLAFDFVTNDNLGGAVTGHADGVVTILIMEADSVAREQLRKQMSSPIEHC
jgi:hypothetical protein